MADNQPHFEIPKERVRVAAVRVRGQAKPYSRPSYSAHADFLRERAASLREYAADIADATAAEALFLQVRTPPELPARGERQRLHAAGLEIVALSPVDANSATVQMRKSDLHALERKIDRYGHTPDNVGKSYLMVIDDLKPVPVEEKLALEPDENNDDPVDCLLVFYASLTERERAAILLAVRSFMGRAGVAIGGERRLTNGVTVVEARLRPSEARATGAAFSTLRQIVPNSVYFVPDGWRISNFYQAPSVEPPTGRTSVAVIDTGISPACDGVSKAVVATLPHVPTGSIRPHYEHGTFVASRILYGDGLETSLRSGALRPACPLVDVPVVGTDARGERLLPNEGHLASAIDSALASLPGSARVVNLSLGTNASATDGRVSLVAQLLDAQARERDLLIVTTAGNIRDTRLLATYPQSHLLPIARIDPPGDSLLSVTVGSIAKFTDAEALSKARELSAFSRRGPGPLGGLKPDLVAHGGNCLANGNTSARIGVHGLAANGTSWECDYGTSFAAPLVSGMAAALFDHYNNPSANMVRALLLHFADPVISPSIGVEPEYLTGLGEPSLDAARWSRDHSAAFLHSGDLTASSHSFLPFFVPSCLAAGSDARLEIKVTVVIDPPVSPDNHLEYAKSRVTVALRKPAEVGHHSVSVSADTVEADKWSPITHLSKAFHRSYETGEWELQLRLWTRGVEPGFKQSFSAIIEVIDASGTQPVRTAVESEAGSAYRVIAIRAAA